jgi:beta-galactosidase
MPTSAEASSYEYQLQLQLQLPAACCGLWHRCLSPDRIHSPDSRPGQPLQGARAVKKRTFPVLATMMASVAALASGQPRPLARPLFGVAYYDEYMPYDRLDQDVRMMKDTGITVVRIAESTWGTLEPQDGTFDFRHVDRVLDAMHRASIGVIVGTPTYAVPTWLARKYPDVLAVTPRGQNQYGPRQNMDITNAHFRAHAERVIRKLMEHVKDHPAVIGYQVDNETKPYQTAGPAVQALFVRYMKDTFKTLDAVNRAFGLDYWSNRINSWEDFPSTVGSINASLNAEFAKFQRQQVTDYLAWQTAVVKEYARPGQFVTHNFDLDWRGHSFGIQPEVDHFAAARALDVAGIDIYHPTQDALTGIEISFGGDLARSMKGGRNYFVIETQAQGFPQWTPYPGQLRLQAFSHLASGANMVSYWHWHSIHNSAETYWKGLLSHDFRPNPTYDEAGTIGRDLAAVGTALVDLRKTNRTAILFSNEALTAFNAFGLGGGFGGRDNYNDVVRPLYDALYRMNVGVDFIDPSSENLAQYRLIVVPALYAAPDALLQRLNRFVADGGHVVYTFKSGFSDENVKVRSTPQPGLLADACGVSYTQFTLPRGVQVSTPYSLQKGNDTARLWMELLTPTTATPLARYQHPAWGAYAGATENRYGKGVATYIGFMPSDELLGRLLERAARNAGVWGPDQELAFPLVTKSGTNRQGKVVHYYFNYSAAPASFRYPHKAGTDLLSGQVVATDSTQPLPAWGVLIVVER